MGKTTAAGMFRRLGVPVHESDIEVHYLLGPGGAAVTAVTTLFPQSATTQEGGAAFIDRSKLGKIVFSDPEKRKQLEEILHPMVRRAQDEFLAVAAASGAKVAVLDIPLLFETGADKRVDVTVCVSAPAFVQKKRVMSRPGMTAEKFSAILASQLSDHEKRKRADFVVQTGLGRVFSFQKIWRILRQAEKMKKQAAENG